MNDIQWMDIARDLRVALENKNLELVTVQAERDAALQRAEQAESQRDGLQHAYDVITDAIAKAVGDGDPSGPCWADGVWLLHQRAAQADAALAQAQAERDEWRQKAVTVALTHADTLIAAQPPALPPLPSNWEHYVKPASWDARKAEWESWGHLSADGTSEMTVTAYANGVCVECSDDEFQRFDIPDLITVLRHAEAAHQRLKEGSRG